MQLFKHRINRSRVAALLLGLTTSPLTALAQLAPSPDAPPVSTAPAPPTQDETTAATLKLEVNLVELLFTVKDKSGKLLPHLTKSDCTVLEDKVPQTLKSFAAESHQPLTLGILLDTSGSQQRVLPLEQETGSRFLQRVLQPQDEAFLLSFDVNVDLLQDYTSSATLLRQAMQQAQINTAGGNGAGGSPGAGGGTIPTLGAPKGTLLYDAVYQAASQKMNQETGRKAIILLTDGNDEGSRLKISEALAVAQKFNVIVYVILIADHGLFGELASGADSAMKKLAEETGGQLINVGNNKARLDAAFQQIEDELRTQYVAAYTSSNTRLDGSFRKISLLCRPGGLDEEGLKVQVRKGYYASAPQN